MNIKYLIKDNKYYTIYYILLNIIEYYKVNKNIKKYKKI